MDANYAQVDGVSLYLSMNSSLVYMRYEIFHPDKGSIAEKLIKKLKKKKLISQTNLVMILICRWNTYQEKIFKLRIQQEKKLPSERKLMFVYCEYCS